MNQLKILIIIFLSLFSSLLYSQSKSLIDQMIDASITGDEEKVLQIKSSIESTTKPSKGDRKTARTLNDKALFELNAGNFDAAVELLTKAYEADPSDTEVASNLGYALIKSGNIKQAEAPFNHSIMLNPNRTDAWANLSVFFADKGDFRSSTAVLNIAYLLSANKDKTKVYFQKFLIDNRENKTLVAAATEALKDEGIKPISKFVISEQPESTNIANELTEATTSTNHDVEESPHIATPSLPTHVEKNDQYKKLANPSSALKADESNDFSQMTNESNVNRQMKTFMGMDIDDAIGIFFFFCIALLLQGFINLVFLSSSNDLPTRLRKKRINHRISIAIFAITVIMIFLSINNEIVDQHSVTDNTSSNQQPAQLVFKGLSLGMPIEEASQIINKKLGKELLVVSTNAESGLKQIYLTTSLMGFPAVMTGIPEKKHILIMANSSGKVISFLLSRDILDVLFETKDMPKEEFMQTFINAYGIPSLKPSKIDLKVNIMGLSKTIGFQIVYSFRSPDGFELNFFDEPIIIDEELSNKARVIGMGDYNEAESMLLRTIDKAEVTESRFD